MTSKFVNWIMAGSVVLLVAACGGEIESTGQKLEEVVTQGNSTPFGSIVGFVTNLRTGAPLANVTVIALSTTADGLQELGTTTGSTGAYGFAGLPAGSTYRLRFTMTGFVARFADALVPNLVGDFPQGNAIVNINVVMASSDAGVTGSVIASGGGPASGATISVDLRALGFDLVAETTSDAQGIYTLSGLPGSPTGLPIAVVAHPFDENGDGAAEYDSVTIFGQTFPGATTRLDIDLRPGAASLILLASDVDDGRHPGDAPISLTFNRPLVLGATTAVLRDMALGYNVATASTLDTSGTILTVTPAGGGALAEGRPYRLSITALATNDAGGSFVRSFDVVASTSGALPPVSGIDVTPSEADWTTRIFTLNWDAILEASGYEVYARDTGNNPSFLAMAMLGNNPTPGTSITLPNSFDVFTGDGIQTPFAFGTSVEIAVVPIDVYGVRGEISAATIITRSDTTAPEITSAAQLGSADNTAGTSDITLNINLAFNEYMDDATLPVIALPVSSQTATFNLDPNMRTGHFEITILAGVDGTGDYTISGGQDSSGNTLLDYTGTLSAVVQVVSNGTFEGATCDLTGWTASTTGSTPLPAATSADAASGTCSARIGNSGAIGSQSGTSSVYQDIVLPAGASSASVSITYKRYSNASIGHDDVWCDVLTTSGGFLTRIFLNDSSSTMAWTTETADLTAWSGTTVRIQCTVYQDSFHATGMYIDDISVLVIP